MKEATIELTDKCNHFCIYCSSDAGPYGQRFLTVEQVETFLDDCRPDIVHVSGGEPLLHPKFGEIFALCKRKIKDPEGVILHTNEITHIAYNINVIPRIRVDAYAAVPDSVHMLHVVRLVPQGREREVRERFGESTNIKIQLPGPPAIHFSRNWSQACECDHPLLKPDGTVAAGPCRKGKNTDSLSVRG